MRCDDLRSGIGADEAATIAVYANPALRAIRDRRGLAAAQLIQTGILPNPVVSYARDYVTGATQRCGHRAYNFSAGWEFSALVPFLPKQTAARKNFRSVDLDVALQEGQIAVNARTAVYRVLALDAQVVRAREALETMRSRIDGHIIQPPSPPIGISLRNLYASSAAAVSHSNATENPNASRAFRCIRRQGLRFYFGVAVGLVAVSTGAAVGEAAACAAEDGEVAGAAVGEEPGEA